MIKVQYYDHESTHRTASGALRGAIKMQKTYGSGNRSPRIVAGSAEDVKELNDLMHIANRSFPVSFQGEPQF